jgi:glutamine amidotransferase
MEFLKPMGDTDSETAFCVILEEIRKYGRLPSDKDLAITILKTAKELSKQGGLNFLISNGEMLHAFYSGYKSMFYTTIRPPFEDKIIGQNDQLKILLKTRDIQTPISIIATEPFFDEFDWKEFEVGTLYSFKNGQRMKFLY